MAYFCGEFPLCPLLKHELLGKQHTPTHRYSLKGGIETYYSRFSLHMWARMPQSKNMYLYSLQYWRFLPHIASFDGSLYQILFSENSLPLSVQYRWFGGGEVEGIPLVFEENSPRTLNQTKPHINICMKKIECIKPKHWDSKKCQKQPKSTASSHQVLQDHFLKHQETPWFPVFTPQDISRYLNWRSWAKMICYQINFIAIWGGMFWAARSCGCCRLMVWKAQKVLGVIYSDQTGKP